MKIVVYFITLLLGSHMQLLPYSVQLKVYSVTFFGKHVVKYISIYLSSYMQL